MEGGEGKVETTRRGEVAFREINQESSIRRKLGGVMREAGLLG